MWVNCRSNYDPSSLKTKLLLLFYFIFLLILIAADELFTSRSSLKTGPAWITRTREHVAIRESEMEKKKASRLKVCKQSCARSHTEWRPGVSICASFHMITILASSRAAVSLSLTLFQRVHNSTITSRCYTFDGCSPCTPSSVAGGGRGENWELRGWGGATLTHIIHGQYRPSTTPCEYLLHHHGHYLPLQRPPDMTLKNGGLTKRAKLPM